MCDSKSLKSIIENGQHECDNGLFLSSLKRFASLPNRSLSALYYTAISYARLGYLYLAIDHIYNYKTKLFRSNRNIKLTVSSVCLDKSLLELQNITDGLLYLQIDTVQKLKDLELFFVNNLILVMYCHFLSYDQSRRLSNALNVLADHYYFCHKFKPSLVCYKFANFLYSESVYSRINFARLASKIHSTNLAVENLLEAKRLIYHTGCKFGFVLDPHSNSHVLLNQSVFNEFVFLSREYKINLD